MDKKPLLVRFKNENILQYPKSIFIIMLFVLNIILKSDEYNKYLNIYDSNDDWFCFRAERCHKQY